MGNHVRGLRTLCGREFLPASAGVRIAAGVPLELVSQILGHSNVSMTFSVYGRYRPEHMLAGIEHLDFGLG